MLGATLAFEYERVRNETVFLGLGTEKEGVCTAKLGAGNTPPGKASTYMHVFRKHTHMHATHTHSILCCLHSCTVAARR